MNRLFLCLLVLFFTGCAGYFKPAPDFSRINVGMNKQQVIASLGLGKPTHVSAESSRELLAYEWDNLWDGKPAGMWSFVGLNNGRVTGYYSGYLEQSTNFNVAEAWTRVQSAPRTTINQSSTAILQNQTNNR